MTGKRECLVCGRELKERKVTPPGFGQEQKTEYFCPQCEERAQERLITPEGRDDKGRPYPFMHL
jgi:predicted RNA-binding Zn-ribbon protein involved in translation (DUF1610 family)